MYRIATGEYFESQRSVHDRYKTLKKSIVLSRAYFDLKMSLNKQLEDQKRRLKKLQQSLLKTKNMYTEAFKNLEVISNEIHEARKKNLEKLSDED